MVATGAGANTRHSLGTAVFGGLLVSTILSLLIVPVLYVVIKGLQDRFLGGTGSKPDDSTNGKMVVSESATPQKDIPQPQPQNNLET